MKQNTNAEEVPAVLDPVREISIGGRNVSVREMSWPQMLKFIRMLSKEADKFVKDGKFVFNAALLGDLIGSVDELSAYLMLNAASVAKEDLETISFSEGCELLDAALAVNLNEEVMGKAKKAASRFALVMGVNGKGAPGRTESPGL